MGFPSQLVTEVFPSTFSGSGRPIQNMNHSIWNTQLQRGTLHFCQKNYGLAHLFGQLAWKKNHPRTTPKTPGGKKPPIQQLFHWLQPGNFDHGLHIKSDISFQFKAYFGTVEYSFHRNFKLEIPVVSKPSRSRGRLRIPDVWADRSWGRTFLSFVKRKSLKFTVHNPTPILKSHLDFRWFPYFWWNKLQL